MKKLIGLVILVCLTSGCAFWLLGAGLGTAYMATSDKLAVMASQNRKNIEKLAYGISKYFAQDVMGKKTIRYIHNQKQYVISNPVKTKVIQEWPLIEAMYYLTNPDKDDSVILDEELTPLVFERGLLVGWDWDTLYMYEE